MEARESALGKKTVLKLTEKLRDKHVYFDNYVTSVELLEELLQRQTYGCRTVRNGNCESKVNDFQCELFASFYDH